MDKGGNEINEVMVSVFCETFNHEPFIRQCLDGMLMQKTDFAFEVLIHDDASTDHTQMIIKEYAEKYPDIIKPILQHENQYSKGVDIWQTFQMPRARGKYIALCEGDDYWTDPLKLQKQVDFLETHLDFSMCFHGAMVKNETDTKQLTTCDQVEEKEYLTNDIFPGWVIPTASVIYRKSMIDKYPPLRHIEWRKYGDIELFLKCTHTGKVWGMSEFMSVYRMTDNGAVVSQNRDPMTQYKLILHYRFLMENFPQLDKRWPKAFISTYYYTQFRSSIGIGEKLKAVAIAFYYSPKYVIQKLLKKHPRGTY